MHSLEDTIDAIMSIRDSVMSKVASNVTSAQSAKKAQYDKRRHATEYRLGDNVLLKNLAREDSKSGRFTERRTGPYTVAEICGKNTYRLVGENNNVLKRKVNASNLTVKHGNAKNVINSISTSPVRMEYSMVPDCAPFCRASSSKPQGSREMAG